MDEVEQRLKEATDNCLACHAEWNKNRKDSKVREHLMEAVHELRKVAARLEIEIAISERDEMASKPIPIPPHRSNKRKAQEEAEDIQPSGNDGGDRHQQPRGNRGPRRRVGGGGGGNKES